jgi:hypothetical protein
MQASTLSSDDNPSPLPSKTTHRKYHFGSRSPSGQSPVTKSRKAPHNLHVSPSPLTHSLSLGKDASDKETSSPKQKSWKHFVTNQFKKMQPQTDSPTSNDNVSESCILSQCTPVRHFLIGKSLILIFTLNFYSRKRTFMCRCSSPNARKLSRQKA